MNLKSLLLKPFLLCCFLVTNSYSSIDHKNIIPSLAAGALAGGIGYKLYQKYKNDQNTLERTKQEECNLNDPDADPLICVVGGGFGGVAMGLKLRERGFRNFVILEKNESVGGAWLLNTYPGCACDIPSHLYSLSQAPNPNWSKSYASQPEILEYIQNVASENDLNTNLHFGEELKSATYNEKQNEWMIESQNRDGSKRSFKSKYFVSAMGPLHHPNYPIGQEERDQFKGKQCHTANWFSESDICDKNVAIIGGGASGLQLIPALGLSENKPKKMTLISSSLNYIVPRENPMLPKEKYPEYMKAAFRNVPMLTHAYRLSLYMMHELSFFAGIFDAPKKCGTPSRTRELSENFVKSYMNDKMKKRPELEGMVPKDYPLGCKRILKDPGFLDYVANNPEAFEMKMNRVTGINELGPILDDGTQLEVDAIVWATGFEVGSIGDVQIVGIREKSHTGQSIMKSGGPSFYGISMRDFPNFFMLAGLNTGVGHNSILNLIQSQVDNVVNTIEQAENKGADRIEIKPEKVAAFTSRLKKLMKKRIWQRDFCKSWYQNEEGIVTTNWPESNTAFWRETANRNLEEDYNIQKK
ncbi:NAD(P)/FAD-dependent oxidoreductase [Bacteriovoracaceae bacterium]|nr:NAD(P)/FAD-dependent oxidoreductase [Bacteriovoracaceae bacterium]